MSKEAECSPMKVVVTAGHPEIVLALWVSVDTQWSDKMGFHMACTRGVGTVLGLSLSLESALP